ncbi:MAG: hypothetical protein HYX47_01995 [Burkholderiales bacterium]|nr:hypothetical protein [Burkholderiales bacterium]
MRHFAVLISKPHLSTHLPMMMALVQSRLQQLRISVLSEQKVLFTPEILRVHYLPHSLFAYESAASHRSHLQPATIRALEARGASTINELIHSRRYLGACEAVSELAITPIALYEAWEAARDQPATQVGYHFKLIETKSGAKCLVSNAYFPYRFGLMERSRDESHAWLLEYPDGFSIFEGRRTLLGELGGSPSTLRGFVAAESNKLRLHVDKFNNGFHLSDTLGSALRETAFWFPEERHLLTSGLKACGIECNSTRATEFLTSHAFAFQCSASQEAVEVRSAYDSLYPADSH